MKTSKTSLDDSMRGGGGKRERKGGGKPNHRECLQPLSLPLSVAKKEFSVCMGSPPNATEEEAKGTIVLNIRTVVERRKIKWGKRLYRVGKEKYIGCA